MNNKIIIILMLILFVSMPVYATYVYENKDGEYSTDVDKFVPQSGVKIKTSKLANMMENGTRNAMDGNKGNNQMPQQVQRINTNKPLGRAAGKRSYKWF